MSSRPSTDKLIDEFVAKSNDGCIRRVPSAEWFEALESRLPRRLPPSYRSLATRYAFPAFDLGPVHLFANTGAPEEVDELSVRVFLDPVMSGVLLRNGYVQIGRPVDGSYDPVCFDLNERRGGGESPIVRIDHESALQWERVAVKERIADSFSELLSKNIRSR